MLLEVFRIILRCWQNTFLIPCSDIDPATVAQVRAVIERDIAFLALAPDDQRALINAVVEAAGDSMAYPRLEELDLDASPSVLEAARILVEVLLREL